MPCFVAETWFYILAAILLESRACFLYENTMSFFTAIQGLSLLQNMNSWPEMTSFITASHQATRFVTAGHEVTSFIISSMRARKPCLQQTIWFVTATEGQGCNND